MIPEFKVPKSGQPLASLGPVMQAFARAGNGLRKLRFESADEYGFEWDEGAAVIKGPAFGLSLVQMDFCEDGVQGTRYVLCTDFVPDGDGDGDDGSDS